MELVRIGASVRLNLNDNMGISLADIDEHVKYAMSRELGTRLYDAINREQIKVRTDLKDIVNGYQSYSVELVVACGKDIEEEIERRVHERVQRELKSKCKDTLTQVTKILSC